MQERKQNLINSKGKVAFPQPGISNHEIKNTKNNNIGNDGLISILIFEEFIKKFNKSVAFCFNHNGKI